MFNEDNYCEHGTYVGGCGIDWMCGWCEEGTPYSEYLWILMNARIKSKIALEARKMTMYRILREAGKSPEEIVEYMHYAGRY